MYLSKDLSLTDGIREHKISIIYRNSIYFKIIMMLARYTHIIELPIT